MATTPGGLPYPVGTDKVVDGDDAIKALALAVDPAFTGWTIYVPALTGITPGNGVLVAYTKRVGRTVDVVGRFGLGSTSVITGQITIGLPAGVTWAPSFNDASQSAGIGTSQTAVWNSLVATPAAPGAFFLRTSGGAPISNTVPGGWAPGNLITWAVRLESAV